MDLTKEQKADTLPAPVKATPEDKKAIADKVQEIKKKVKKEV